jgi:hypothetical protein
VPEESKTGARKRTLARAALARRSRAPALASCRTGATRPAAGACAQGQRRLFEGFLREYKAEGLA